MKFLLVLTLAVCARASEPPDYIGAYSNGEKGALTLLRHLTHIQDHFKVEYLALKAAVSGTAALEVLLNLSYDQAYSFAPILAEVGRSIPDLVRNIAEKKMTAARSKTYELRMLVERLCFTDLLARPAKCNEFIEAEVQKNSVLQSEAPLFLAIGDLSFDYLTKEPELVRAAKRDLDTYLFNGKEKLRELVQDNAMVLRIMFSV